MNNPPIKSQPDSSADDPSVGSDAERETGSYVAASGDAAGSKATSNQTVGYRPSLPDFGCFLRWPQAGTEWIAPEDVETVERLVPSRRVFKRVGWDGDYYTLEYGPRTFRVRPTLWLHVPAVDLSVGEQVEVLERNGHNDPGIRWVAEILYQPREGEIEFRVRTTSMMLEQAFHRDDLRKLKLSAKLRVGYYEHPRANWIHDGQEELLNVGDLFVP